MYWFIIRTKRLRTPSSKDVIDHLDTLVRPGDISCEVDYAEAIHIRGKYGEGLPVAAPPPVVLLYSDRSDDAYELAHMYRDALYGIIYPTGVMVGGPMGVLQPAHVIESGAPLHGYEALVLPVKDRQTSVPEWLPAARALWGGVDEAIRYAYEGGPRAQARSAAAASFPDLRGDWEMIYVLPEEDDEAVASLLASAGSFELSKIAVLGRPSKRDLEQLDNRFTCFCSPPAALVAEQLQREPLGGDAAHVE